MLLSLDTVLKVPKITELFLAQIFWHQCTGRISHFSQKCASVCVFLCVFVCYSVPLFILWERLIRGHFSFIPLYTTSCPAISNLPFNRLTHPDRLYSPANAYTHSNIQPSSPAQLPQPVMYSHLCCDCSLSKRNPWYQTSHISLRPRAKERTPVHSGQAEFVCLEKHSFALYTLKNTKKTSLSLYFDTAAHGVLGGDRENVKHISYTQYIVPQCDICGHKRLTCLPAQN